MFQITEDFFTKRNVKSNSLNTPRGPRILLSAGGTGGHIMPALATAEALRLRNAGVECRFICGRKDVEKGIYKKAGEKPILLPLDRISGTFRGRLCNWGQLIEATWKAHRALVKWRPNALIAFGGYTSAPIILAARVHGIPVYIQEQNAIPGKVNKWFSKSAQRIFIGCSHARRFFNDGKVINTGTPIRSKCSGRNRERARKHFQISNDAFAILAVGGSQGAMGLNEIFFEALNVLHSAPAISAPVHIIWGTGEMNFDLVFERLNEKYSPEIIRNNHNEKYVKMENGNSSISISLFPFLQDMGRAYAASDVAISRAGAGSLAELLANTLPAILIPYPYASNDHQKINAKLALDEGAAAMIEESTPDASNLLAKKLKDLMKDADSLNDMQAAANRLAAPDAADQIAQVVLEDLIPRAASSAGPVAKGEQTL